MEFKRRKLDDESVKSKDELYYESKIGKHMPAKYMKFLSADKKHLCVTSAISPHLDLLNASSLHQVSNIKNDGAKTIDSLVELLSERQYHSVIAIDGMTGVGKSSLIEKLAETRLPVKLNRKYFPTLQDETFNLRRNYEPYHSFFYFDFTLRITEEMISQCLPVVWDRHCLSNYAWYAINFLLAQYSSSIIPVTYTQEISACLQQWFHEVDFPAVVEWIKSQSKQIEVIYLIDSSVASVANRIVKRNNPNDIPNISDVNFLTAQLHVYRYIASMTNSILIDFADYIDGAEDIDEHGSITFATLDRIQMVLVHSLEYAGKKPTDEQRKAYILDLLGPEKSFHSDIAAFNVLTKKLDFSQNQFAFENSKK